MSAEHRPNYPELKAFRLTFERVKYTPGFILDLANSATDTVSGFKRTYSSIIPLAGEETIKEALEIFAKEFVPKGTREEISFRHHSHHDDVISSWPTIDSNVVFEVIRIVDQRGESGRTWRLRNTEKVPGIFKMIAGKLHI